MASIQSRVSRGKKYWSIVESKRVNGKPRSVILQYLGTAETLMKRLQQSKNTQTNSLIKSYSHGDTMALLNIASELGITDIINKYIPLNKEGSKPLRDGLSVGASFLLAAIGRSCHPTSKLGWHSWCKETSLEYCLNHSFKDLDSQHFWDQMQALPAQVISQIEDEIVQKLVQSYPIQMDCLFFDTTNFFTFIASDNTHCNLPQRGKNKQHRYDLRQVGMALLVSRQEQFPLFHQTYRGNKNDITTFQEVCGKLIKRIQNLGCELKNVTLVFDKGNNSKNNFKLIDDQEDLHYVGGLVSSYFKDLILEANDHFSIININGESVPIYRVKKEIWGKERTCVITISAQLLEGQIKGIHQHLEKKFKELEKFKKQLENPKSKKGLSENKIIDRLTKIIRGQFIEDILTYKTFLLENGHTSFTYRVDQEAFEKLKKEVLGRKITVSNRHEWSNEEILLAYHGQSHVEDAFRNLKNPYHLAIRPQFHWTDQKIEVHFLICMIGYLLTVAAYQKARQLSGYSKNISNFMEDLRTIRLTSIIDMNTKTKKGGLKVLYQLEKINPELENLTKTLNITNENLRPNIAVGVYNS